MATPANAATFIFSSGNYIPGVTAPEPLLSPDILELTTGSNKFWNGVSFTNQSGTVNWTGGTLFLQSGATINSQSLWNTTANDSIVNNGGATSTFNNSGIFRKSAGTGSTTISNAFVNNGTIDAQTGTIAFNGGLATFNTGSVFVGAGINAINSNAAFNGAISSTNLDFNGGTFTGTNAALSGAADWNAGTFAGSWNLTSGSTLTAQSGSNKFLNGANFSNPGTVNWRDGTLFLQNGSQIVNNGTIAITSNNSINNNGGAASSFTNNGLIQKTAGTGTSTLANGIALDNNGTINVLSGTIALPAAFNNDGTLGGTGTFASTNLTNDGSIAPGALGATGTLALTGNFFQSASGFLNSQLASSGSSDLFNISGTAGISGTLALSCILGCAISTGDSFVLLDSIGALSGTFSNITTSGFRTGFSFDVVYDYGADLVRLNVLDAGLVGGGVPEPSTWAMLILGFGMVGRAMRKRSTTRASVLA